MNTRPKSSRDMETREQAEQAAAVWIAQRETGPWNEEEAAAFEEWLSGSATRKVAYFRFKKTWEEAGRLEALGAGQLPDHPLSSIFDATDSPASLKARGGRVWYAVAACVLLSVAAALFLLRNEIFGLNSYKTLIGGLTTVPMADGSRVTLNTDSRLRISLNSQERRIELERGEAFFEVAKDPNRPFIVTTGQKRIIAVGTQFSVRREGDDLRVSVTEGAVRFIVSPADQSPASGLTELWFSIFSPNRASSSVNPAGAPEPGVLLAAGAVARAESTGVLVQRKPISEIEQQLTWKTGLLTFRDVPLVDAVAEFNRYNERKIFIEDPSIAAIEVGGIFRSTDLDPFIRLIENGLALKVSREGNRILLSAR